MHIQGAFDSDGGSFELQDAWASWELDESWTLYMGQGKTPTLREELVSSKYSQFADRSLTNEVFNLGRTQGVLGAYKSDSWRVVGLFSTGADTANTEYNASNHADYAVTGRVDWLFAGDWEQLEDFAGWQGQEYAGQVGGAVHWQDGGSTGVGSVGSTADVQFIQVTGDVQVEANGWNAFGAVIWDYIDPDGADSVSHLGAVIQGGVFVSESDELFGRYDVIIPDSDTAGGDDAFNTIGFGWNHYFIPESHASKFTVDVQVFLNETTENGLVSSNTTVGLLESGNSGPVRHSRPVPGDVLSRFRQIVQDSAGRLTESAGLFFCGGWTGSRPVDQHLASRHGRQGHQHRRARGSPALG